MSKKIASPAKVSKKQIRESVYNKLAAALAEYKDTMKEKKFVSHLKKASRMFAEDIHKKGTKYEIRVAKKEKPGKSSSTAIESA